MNNCVLPYQSSKILVISGVESDIQCIKVALFDSDHDSFVIEYSRRLADGVARLNAGGFDAVIASLSLDDSFGIATFMSVFAAALHVPVIILIPAEEEALALEAVRLGARGYLLKGGIGKDAMRQVVRNIIQRSIVEEAYYEKNARAEIILNSISDAVISTDLTGLIDYFNSAAEVVTGWDRAEAQGQPISEVLKLINGATRQPCINPVDHVLLQDRPMGLSANTILVRRDGSEAAIEDSTAPVHNWAGKIVGAVMVFHDVSAAKAMSIKMAHLAQHDFLTNLPNRVLLTDRLSQAIRTAKRRNMQIAVLFLDLDNFKNINDSLGHEIGDNLLKAIAARLLSSVRESDTVSRQGGDEFVILLSVNDNIERISLISSNILCKLKAPFSLKHHKLYISASMGISIYPYDGGESDILIKNADTAMYYAKKNGKNTYKFYDQEMNLRAIERQSIESKLHLAMDRNELVLHYQPLINLESGGIIGCEALLRWFDAAGGVISPEKFIPIAEDCGLIVPIGRWALLQACLQAKQWGDAGLKTLSMAVNISAVEFRRSDFVDGVRVILRDTCLDPALLQLEITENVLMSNAEFSKEVLAKLKDMGVSLAIDDFGSGYSSLNYLKQFPIDIIKIDQSFVRDITSAPDGAIISAIIGMGNILNKRVVAEGIEEIAQLEFLKAHDCELGQGFLFSRPLAARHFADLLEHGFSV